MAKNKYYFSYNWLERKGCWVGIVSLGSPQRGDDLSNVMVVHVLTADSEEEIRKKGRVALKTQPWLNS